MYEDDNKEVLDENELLKSGFVLDEDDVEDDSTDILDEELDGSIRDEDDELFTGDEEESY